MNTKLLVLSLTAATLSAPALAEESPWMVRVRVLNMQVENSNSPDVAGAKVELNNKTFPEIDFAYNFTPKISAELILTYPQKHDVSLEGAKIGTVKHLPPTLLLQYHFAPEQTFNPYVGAGLNYTRLMSVDLPAGVTADRNSAGFALQVGADIKVAENTYINLDYKRIGIESDIKVGGIKLTTLEVDPNLFSVGIGWRF